MAACAARGRVPVADHAPMVLRLRGRSLGRQLRPDLMAAAGPGGRKTWLDSVGEMREAVDFLRYYAGHEAEAMADFRRRAGSLPRSARGTSRWRSSPGRSRRRWPRAMRCWPNRPSRRL